MSASNYLWHLRTKMAERGMFATTDLQPLLAERGIALSREQTYRLVTGQPQRLSMATLIALCDILECTPNDLIEPRIVEASAKKASGEVVPLKSRVSARRTTINRPGHVK